MCSQPPSLIRVFFGIPIVQKDAALFKQLVLEKYPLIDNCVRWTREGNFHITVRFIGNIKTEKLAEITAAVKPITQQFIPFHTQVNEISHFPSSKSGILAGIVTVSREFAKLYEKLDSALTAIGYPGEERGFKPHITLCRPKGKPHYQITSIPLYLHEFYINELILYKSEPVEGGSLYIPLKRFALKQSTC